MGINIANQSSTGALDMQGTIPIPMPAVQLQNLGGTNCSINAGRATLTGHAQLHFGTLKTCNVGLLNLADLSGTHIADYQAQSGSTTTFNLDQNESNFKLPDGTVLKGNGKGGNRGTTTFGAMTIDPNAHVSTPGATKEQAGELYSSLAMGNVAALDSGKMSAMKAGAGSLAAANGLFNANKGVMNNNYKLENLQFGEIAVPVGAAIAGGVADGISGDFFNHEFNGKLMDLQYYNPAPGMHSCGVAKTLGIKC